MNAPTKTPAANAVAKLAVSTTPPLIVPAGFVEVTARTRATKDKETGKKTEIAADQRSRSILMPELTPNVSGKYASLVLSALHEVAKQQLDAQWSADANLREVDAALYKEDSLLLYAAREAESKKLNADAIGAWFKGSELCKELSGKYTAAQIAKFQKELEHLAAPVTSSDIYNEDKALKRIVTLGKNAADSEHEVCAALIGKLSRYVARIQKAREDIGSVEDIDA